MDEQREFYSSWRARFRTETPLATLDPQDAADWQLIDDQIGLNLLEFDRIQNYRHNPDRSGRTDRQRAVSAADAELTRRKRCGSARCFHAFARFRGCSIR